MASDYRQVRDPNAVRAMTHRVRWTILELIQTQGPLTATQLSDLIGESPANCSFHLRTLAKYGFIADTGSGKGRERPWKSVDFDWSVEEGELSDAEKPAAKLLGQVLRERAFRRIEAWYAGQRDHYPDDWRGASFDQEVSLPMTLSELKELQTEIKDLISRHHRDNPSDDAVQVTFTAWALPTGNPTKAKRWRDSEQTKR